MLLGCVLVAAGCAPQPLAGAEIIAGSETTVTLTTGQWVNAQQFADRYCAQFDRDAIRHSRSTLDASNLISIWSFDCVDRHR